MNMAVLEHVKSPKLVLKEIQRVLKPKGKVFSVIPIMQPFLPSWNRIPAPRLRKNREWSFFKAYIWRTMDYSRMFSILIFIRIPCA
jgi:ubiquinone/menaquinone biosynthesis C-methylase UbiE